MAYDHFGLTPYLGRIFNASAPNPGGSLTSLGSAGYRAGFRFVVEKSCTLDEAHFDIWSIVGTLAPTDIYLDVYECDVVNGLPTGGVLATSNTITPGAWAAGAVGFTGINCPLVAGKLYVISLRNANADPGNNYPRITYTGGGWPQGSLWGGNSNVEGGAFMASGNGGITWSVNYGGSTTPLIKTAEGDWYGSIYRTSGTYYSPQLNYILGRRLTTPPVAIRVAGVVFSLSTAANTATARPLARIRDWATKNILVSGSKLWTRAGLGLTSLFFETPYEVPANSDVAFTIELDPGTNAIAWPILTTRFSTPAGYTRPGGHAVWYNGSAWSEYPDDCPQMAIILDPEIAASGGGGGAPRIVETEVPLL